MRLNKIERDLKINDLKLSFSKFWTKVKVFVGGSFLVANIAACTPAVEDVNATSVAPTTTTESVVPSSSEEVASSEVTQSSEVQPTESTEVVEPTEEVNENTITAEDAFVYVNQLMENHKDMPGVEYIPAAVLAYNFDDMTLEEQEKFMNLFGLSNDSLSSDFKKFCDGYRTVTESNYRYYAGENDTLKYPYDVLVKFEELALTKNGKENAKTMDGYIYDYSYAKGASELGLYVENIYYMENPTAADRMHFCLGMKVLSNDDYDNIFDVSKKENVNELH